MRKNIINLLSCIWSLKPSPSFNRYSHTFIKISIKDLLNSIRSITNLTEMHGKGSLCCGNTELFLFSNMAEIRLIVVLGLHHI